MSLTETRLHAPAVIFDEDRLMSVSVCDDDSVNYMDPTIFNISYRLHHFKTNQNGIFEMVSIDVQELRPCSIEDVPSNPALIQQLGLKNAYCLKNKNFKLEGYWDESEIFYVDVELYPCSNETMNNTCKTPEEINNFFSKKRKFFQAYFHVVGYQADDYLDPIKEKYENIYQLVDNQLFKKYYIFLKNLEVITNDGWFFSQISSETNIMIDKTNTDVLLRDSDKNGSLSELVFFASHEFSKNTRRYQNLSETLANLLGIGNLLIFFCYLVTNFMNHIKNMTSILNSLYVFPMKSNLNIMEKVSSNQTKKKFLRNESLDTKNIRILPRFKKVAFHFEDSGNLTSDAPGFIKGPSSSQNISSVKSFNNLMNFFYNKQIVKQKNKLNIGFFEFIIFYFKWLFGFRKTRKEQIIRKAGKIYKKELDIMKILAKIQEIEKLKLILLNEDQLILFDSLAKPMASLNNYEDEEDRENGSNSSFRMTTLTTNYKKANRDEKRFVVSYNNIRNASDGNPINQRLLDLLRKNLEKFVPT